MGEGGMSTTSGNFDVKYIDAGHDRAVGGGELANRQSRQVVHAKHFFDVEPLHHAIVDHGLAARATFLGWLENHRNLAREISCLAKIFSGAQ